jgi:hypothetical protein
VFFACPHPLTARQQGLERIRKTCRTFLRQDNRICKYLHNILLYCIIGPSVVKFVLVVPQLSGPGPCLLGLRYPSAIKIVFIFFDLVAINFNLALTRLSTHKPKYRCFLSLSLYSSNFSTLKNLESSINTVWKGIWTFSVNRGY